MQGNRRNDSTRDRRNLDQFYKEWLDEGPDYNDDVDGDSWDSGDSRTAKGSWRKEDRRAFEDSWMIEDDGATTDSFHTNRSRTTVNRDSRDTRDLREFRDSRDARDSREFRDSQDYRDSQKHRDSRGYRDSQNSRDSRINRDSQNSRDSRNHRPGKKKKTSKVGILILSFIILLCIGGFAYYYFLGNSYLIEGKWVGRTDYSNDVINSVKDYLAGIEGIENINIDEQFENISIKTVFLINSSDTYEKVVDEDSYNVALDNAKSGLKTLMQELLTIELDSYEVKTDATIEELIQEMLGMSLDEYLEQHGPQLLPSLSDISEKENSSGTYDYSRDNLKLKDSNGNEASVPYLVSDDLLVLSVDGTEYIYQKDNG